MKYIKKKPLYRSTFSREERLFRNHNKGSCCSARVWKRNAFLSKKSPKLLRRTWRQTERRYFFRKEQGVALPHILHDERRIVIFEANRCELQNFDALNPRHDFYYFFCIRFAPLCLCAFKSASRLPPVSTVPAHEIFLSKEGAAALGAAA